MKKLRKLTRILTWTLSGGILLQLLCTDTFGKFLAPVVQPVIGQVLSQVSSALTNAILQITTSLLNQALGVPTNTGAGS